MIKYTVSQWQINGTKILGWLQTIQAIMGVWMGISGLIPAEQMPYWLAVSGTLGVFTIKRGYTNSKSV